MSADRNISLLSGFVAAVALAFSGYQVAAGVEASREAQAKALENLRIWKDAYEALKPVNAQWPKAFGVGASAGSQDLVAIGQSLRLGEAGLSFDLNQLKSDKIESVSYEGVAVGLSRICVSGGALSGIGLGVTAPSMADLIRGIEHLQRRDIEIKSIDVSSANGQPSAVLGGLCVLVRSGEDV